MGFRRLAAAFLTVAATALAVSPAFGAAQVVESLRPYVGSAEDAMVPMRDGVRLWTSVYFPKAAGARVPVILIRTPYSFNLEASEPTQAAFLRHLLERGYAVAFQDERGRFWSEGRYSLLAGGRDDGYDTVDWIARQPWSNGRVGTYGCSSSGDSQVLLMTRAHPAHRAAIVMSAGSSVGALGPFDEQGLFYRGGAIQLAWGAWFAALGQRDFPKFPEGITPGNRDALASAALAGSWMEDFKAMAANPDLAGLPAATVGDAPGGQRTDWDDFVGRKPNDHAWSAMQLLRSADKIGVPALWVLNTHDIGVSQQLVAFEHAIGAGAVPGATEQQRAIISPLGHCSILTETERTVDGERAIGDARFPYIDVFTRWFDEKLRDAPAAAAPLPRLQVYVPGADRWQSFATWPPQSASLRFYLGSTRGANTRLGDGTLSPQQSRGDGQDRFTYDPNDPVPTVGGDALLSGPTGSLDHAAIETRRDVLVYATAPLGRPLTVIGMVDVQLEVSSDAPDTDFTANLVDVSADGKAYVLNGSIQRARWRDGYDREARMVPGGVYKLRVGPFFVSNRFLAGHRLALEVSSSSVPRFERNLNTGGANFAETAGKAALNAVHFGRAHPSFVTLPVIDEALLK